MLERTHDKMMMVMMMKMMLVMMMKAMLTMMKRKKMRLRVCACVFVCVCLCMCVCIPPSLDKIKLKYFRFLFSVIVSGGPSNVGKPKVSKIIFPNGPQHNNIEGGRINKRFQKTSTCFSLILSRVVGYNSKNAVCVCVCLCVCVAVGGTGGEVNHWWL